jgi:hypothetical protein
MSQVSKTPAPTLSGAHRPRHRAVSFQPRYQVSSQRRHQQLFRPTERPIVDFATEYVRQVVAYKAAVASDQLVTQSSH